MSDKKEKLTPEQLQKMQQLQMMMQQMQAGSAKGQGQVPKGPKPPLPKRIFIGILQKMSESVKFIDSFINFIVKKDGGGKANDVVKSARAPILFGVWVTIFFAVFGLIWAGFAPLDSASVAFGNVISSSKKQSITIQETGVLKELLVKVGDPVQKGQPLIILDDVRYRTSYQDALNQYYNFLAAEARLVAELENEDSVDFPAILLENSDQASVSRIIDTQKKLFHSNREQKQGEMDSLKQKIQILQKNIESYEARGVAIRKNLEIVEERVKANRKLNDQGFAAREKLLETEGREAELKSQLAENASSIINTEQQITIHNIELVNLENRYISRISAELSEIETKLVSSKERVDSLEDVLNKTVLKAPTDGVVNNIYYYTIGSVIPGGANIIEIAPQNDQLIIEAKVPLRQIDSIQTGLVAKIRFSAFKNRTSPKFQGKVVYISPDIVFDIQQQGQVMPIPGTSETQGGYYLARIEIDMDHFNKIAEPRGLKLVPGMQAEVQIVTGTRTMLQYLLDPLYDAMFKGFKER